ncbi:MAG: N-formylglutamate amidohydrolase [archaeon]|nr:N-formylglutamate amidohydrolase [archaeon]
MDLEKIEGYIELKGQKPILLTALHGFGTDRYKLLVKRLKRLDFQKQLKDLYRSSSAVDLFSGEIVVKVGIAKNCWVMLPTLSKVDVLEGMKMPDANLNKEYAKDSLFWKRVGQLIDSGMVKAIIDLHGMRNIKKWPDVCIACGDYATASEELIKSLVDVLKKYRLKVAVDEPFEGGHLIRCFGRSSEIEAFSIELKRNLRTLGSSIAIKLLQVVVDRVEEFISGNNSI